MKTALFAALVMAGMTSPSYADAPGRNWISSARVTHILQRKGFHVTKLEADDGHWEGEALRNHAKYEFHVDPHTGRITKLERDDD